MRNRPSRIRGVGGEAGSPRAGTRKPHRWESRAGRVLAMPTRSGPEAMPPKPVHSAIDVYVNYDRERTWPSRSTRTSHHSGTREPPSQAARSRPPSASACRDSIRPPSRSRAATRSATSRPRTTSRRSSTAAGPVLCRPALQAAGRAAGHRHERQGRHDPRRVRRRSARSACTRSGWKAPSEEERAHDYLWRIHQKVPAAGEIVIFNRSHYEDVLVPVVYRLDHGGADRASATPRSTTSNGC